MRTFACILACVIIQISWGQEYDLTKFENDYLQVRQKPGTEALLKAYLSEAGITGDTAYAFVFSPSECPRCEAGIKVFRKLLSENNKKLLLISVFKDKEIAQFYNKKHGYKADYYLYDTKKEYDKIFSFNLLSLLGAYVVKIDPNGRMITGGGMSDMNDDFVKALIAKKNALPHHIYIAQEEKTISPILYQAKGAAMTRYEDTEITMPDSIEICRTGRMPVYTNDNLLFIDDMIMGVDLMQKQKNKLKFEGLMTPTESEKMRFVKISKKDYDHQKANGMLYHILCNANWLDSAHIGMSYSLPDLSYESENHIAYYNGPCILSRTVKGLSPDSCTNLQFNARGGDYFYKHFQFSSTGEKIIVTCQKNTWPMQYKRQEYENMPSRNSFKAAFYKEQNPYMALFDRKTGKLIKRFGNLDSLCAKHLTGYGFVDASSTVAGNELAYTDGYSGKIYVTDTTKVDDIKTTYTAFKIDEELLPPIYTTRFYNYNYLEPYWKVYCRKIIDVRLTPSHVYCIIAYGDFYNQRKEECPQTFVAIDRKTGATKEWLFPNGNGDNEVMARGMHTIDNKKVYPFEILKEQKEHFVREYKL